MNHQPTVPHDPPPGRRFLAKVALSLIGLALLQLAVGSVYVKPYDEGLILYGASRVAHGAMPYRDFWSMYGPGSFISLAVLDRLFGESVMLGRMMDAAFRSGAVALVFLLAKRMGGQAAAWLAGFAAFFWLAALRQYLFPALPGAVFALWSLFVLAGALTRADGGSPRRWFGVGVAAGFSFLFRPDFGLSTLFACLWAVWVPLRRERFGVDRPAAFTGALGGGFLLVVLPVFAWLLAGVAPADLLDNLVLLPARVYVPNRALPFPDPLATIRLALAAHHPAWALVLTVYVPWLVALGGGVAALVRRLGRANGAGVNQAFQRIFEALLCLLVLFAAKGSVRVEMLHMTPAMLVSLIVMATALRGWHAQPRYFGRTATRLAVSVCVIAAMTMVLVPMLARDHATVGSTRLSRTRCGTDARLGCFELDAGRAAVLRFLDEHARPGDLLYVGTGRHDKVLANDVELYFLSGMAAASKWADIHPGVQTTRNVQQAMIAEMRSRPPAFVVLDTAFDAMQEPNGSSLSSGVTLLDRFLRENYAPTFAAGSLTVSVPR